MIAADHVLNRDDDRVFASVQIQLDPRGGEDAQCALIAESLACVKAAFSALSPPARSVFAERLIKTLLEPIKEAGTQIEEITQIRIPQWTVEVLQKIAKEKDRTDHQNNNP